MMMMMRVMMIQSHQHRRNNRSQGKIRRRGSFQRKRWCVVFLQQMTFSLSLESKYIVWCDLRDIRFYWVLFIRNKQTSLKHIHTESRSSLILLSILILLLTNLKSLAALQRSLSLCLALLTLQTEHQLLGLLRLLITPQISERPSCGR